MKKRADGRYQQSVYIGTDNNGKQKYRVVYGSTKKEVEEKSNSLKIKLGKGIDLDACRETFDYWGKKWIKYKQADVSEQWYKNTQSYYKHLEPLYNLPIAKLSSSDLRDILIDMAQEDYSKRTIKAVYEISVSVIDLAIENRATDYNVFRNVKLPAKVKPAEERRALTDEEQEWVRTTPHRAQTAAMIMMYAGLRKSELIPLQWTDIDLSGKTIKVARFVEFSGNQAKVKNYGKSESAKRIVYIPDVLVDYLKGAKHDGFLVCRTANDKMHSNTSWRRMWESYMSVLNYEHGNFDNTLSDKPTSRFQPGGVPFVIEPFTAHCLRHTFITLMYLAGVDIMTAKEQAGHKDISTTLKIYTHLDKTYKAKNIDKFNEHLNAKLRQAT